MPVAKKAPAKKAAAAKKVAPTRRTAQAKRLPAPPPSEFDKARQKIIKARKPSETVFPWDAYGRTWHVQRPNPALVAAYGDPDYDVGTIEFITGHIIEPERKDFMLTLIGDAEGDFEILGLVIQSIEAVVYAGLPLDQ